MKNQRRIAINNVRIVILLVAVLSFFCFLALSLLRVSPPASLTYVSAIVAFPLMLMINTAFSIKDIEKIKDITGSERRRIQSLAEERYAMTRNVVVFYVIASIAVSVVVYYKTPSSLSLIEVSIAFGLILSSVYSLVAAMQDRAEIASFEAKILARQQAKEKQDSFNKKTSITP